MAATNLGSGSMKLLGGYRKEKLKWRYSLAAKRSLHVRDNAPLTAL
jgi:hypothetical protein